MLDQQNHATGDANSSIVAGMFVCFCLASKKPSQQEFFIPAGTDLGDKLLKYAKLLQCMVTSNFSLVNQPRQLIPKRLVPLLLLLTLLLLLPPPLPLAEHHQSKSECLV
jgi:hypothetical protein